MVQGFNDKNTLRKRRNPFWLSVRGINLGALTQKHDSLWDDDEIPKKS